MGSHRKSQPRRTVEQLSRELGQKRRMAIIARRKAKRKAPLTHREPRTFRFTNDDTNPIKRCLQEASRALKVSNLTRAPKTLQLATMHWESSESSMICSENDSGTDENCARNGFSSASSDSLCSTPPRKAPRSAKSAHRHGKENSAQALKRRAQRRRALEMRAQRKKGDAMDIESETRSLIQRIQIR